MEFASLLHTNIDQVFGERDPAARLKAIQTIYHRDAEFHESQRSALGHEAIHRAVAEILDHLPREFVFRSVRPAAGHNGVARLQWQVGPLGGQIALTGTDVAHLEGGLIRSLYVFLDPPDI